MSKKVFLLPMVCCALSAQAAMWNGFRAPAKAATEHVEGFLWLEAEEFADYGTWVIDTQFVGKMGSAYLLGAGVTGTCANASTRLSVPRAGTWHAWVRTRDWIPEYHPGRFAVEIGGKRSPELGNSGKKGWVWQKAGAYQLAAGETDVRLVDLTGWFARCDAILLTTDAAYVPPEEATANEQARVRFSGIAPETDRGAYDVVVVGAGPAGTTAAIQAARAGVRTLLVSDRPVLGGNASSEFRIPPRGAGTYRPDHQEGGIDAEMLKLKHDTKGFDWTDAYQALVSREKLLTTVTNVRVVAAKTSDRGAIVSVHGVDTLTGARSRWRGKVFVDATGDGWLGYFAGAKYRFGSEGKDEFGEPYAPAEANRRTMSGSIFSGLGSAHGYNAAFQGWKTRGGNFPFETPEWANLELPPWYAKAKNPGWGGKAMEHPHIIDDVEDPEYARDYLIRMSVTYWGWAKNKSANRAEGIPWRMISIPYTNARREGMRLMGDYLLTECDEHEGRTFDDAIGYGGYPITTHDSAGTFGSNHDYNRPEPAVYGIPYRCLYSVNVPNLLMCGRCCSMTHRALGSMRVQSTCAVTGQAAGLAAANCVKTGLSPRAYGKKHIRDLQRELVANGQKLPPKEDFSGCAAVLAGKDVELVANTKREKAAAAVLAKYFEVIFEEQVPVVSKSTNRQSSIVIVEKKGAEPCVTVVAEGGSAKASGGVTISGAEPELGVYVFLEQLASCRFAFPGVHGTLLPRVARLGVKAGEWRGTFDAATARGRAFREGRWRNPADRAFLKTATKDEFLSFFREWPAEGVAADDWFWRMYGPGQGPMREVVAALKSGPVDSDKAKSLLRAASREVIGGTEEWWRIKLVAKYVFDVEI